MSVKVDPWRAEDFEKDRRVGLAQVGDNEVSTVKLWGTDVYETMVFPGNGDDNWVYHVSATRREAEEMHAEVVSYLAKQQSLFTRNI